MVLYNTGKPVLKGLAVFDLSLVGKFKVLDALWEICPQLVEAAKADETGRTSMERVGEVLKSVPFLEAVEVVVSAQQVSSPRS